VNGIDFPKVEFCVFIFKNKKMIHTKTNLLKAFVTLLIIAAGFNANAQDWKSDKKINILFGLSQPLLAHGFNIEGNYINGRFIFDYSHGASLDFDGNSVTPDLRKQGVAVHMPYTTGFGLGYRLKEWLNVRVEPKWHSFEFYYENEPQNINTRITAYKTFSLGIGLYGSYQPFKNKDTFLKGFMISPSIRFWPTVSSNLPNGGFTYFNKNTSTNEEIKKLDPGILFTPLVINVGIGYSFQLKKKN